MSYTTTANLRRVVNFTMTEPSNKYDLWLTKNRHLNEDDEVETTSEYLRNCDYILHIFDCGEWRPITGFNSTAANKLNVVPQDEGAHQYNLPYFNSDESTPDLLSGMDLGLMLLNTNFVDVSEWTTIFNKDYILNILGNVISNYYNSHPNSFNIRRAQPTTLGGIWANTDTSLIAYLHSATTHSPNESAIECLFIKNDTPSPQDNKLYISGRDTIAVIKNLQQSDHSLEFNWRLAESEYIGGIRANRYPNNLDNAFKPVEVKFYPSDSLPPYDSGKLCINAREMKDAIHDLLNDPSSGETPWDTYGDIFRGVNGVLVSPYYSSLEPTLIKITLRNANEEAIGKIPKLIETLSPTYNSSFDLEWIDIPEGTTYTADDGINISEDNEISVKVDGDTISFNNDGELKVIGGGTTYEAGEGIEIDTSTTSNTINVTKCSHNDQDKATSYGGIKANLAKGGNEIIEAVYSIDPNKDGYIGIYTSSIAGAIQALDSSHHDLDKVYTVKGSGNDTDKFLRGDGSWEVPYVLPIATASSLGGIKVGSGLSIEPNTGVLSATGGYTAGDGISLSLNLIALITYTETLSTKNSFTLFTKNDLLYIDGDDTDELLLNKYSFYKLEGSTSGAPISVEFDSGFSFAGLLEPIVIEITTDSATTILSTIRDFVILSNLTVSSTPGTDVTIPSGHYLFTFQYNLLKIEKVGI